MSDLGGEDFYVANTQPKGLGELNIVPILDMFICIIFFLLLSTSMISYTKHVLPPSATKAATGSTAASDIPNNPKIYAVEKAGVYKLIMKWDGAKPDTKSIEFKDNFMTNPDSLVKQVKDLVADYKKQYPNEKTIQVTMQSEFPYQILISVMDGVRESMPDVVLNSYQSADGLQE